MPNWVFNRVEITGDSEQLAKAKELLKDDFDFNRIIPMPESLKMDEGSMTNPSIMYYLAEEAGSLMAALEGERMKNMLEKTSQAVFGLYSKSKEQMVEWYRRAMDHESDPQKLYEDGKQYVSNIENYGHPTWYGWCIENWGTKWGACDPTFSEDADGLCYNFDTAWSVPGPIYDHLHEMFPELVFTITYREETEEYDSVVVLGGK